MEMATEQEIIKEILRSLRGKRSTSMMSKRLGYKSDQVKRWESGHTKLTWNQFLSICAQSKISVKACLWGTTLYAGDPKDLKSLVLHLAPLKKPEELAILWGVTRPSVSKWLSNSSTAPASAIFALFKETHWSLGDFLSQLVPTDERRSEGLRTEIKKYNDHAPVYAHPLTVTLLCLVKLSEIKKEIFPIDVAAKQLGLSQTTIHKTIAQLVSGGHLIEIKTGHYKVASEEDNFSSGFGSYISQIKENYRFWLKYIDEMTKIPAGNERGKNRFGTYEFTCDEKGMAEIQDALLKLHSVVAEVSKRNTGSLVFSLLYGMVDVLRPEFGKLIEGQLRERR